MKDLHSNTDSLVWAKEFLKTFKELPNEQTMMAWFANAIMTGYDAGAARRNKDYITIKEMENGDIGILTSNNEGERVVFIRRQGKLYLINESGDVEITTNAWNDQEVRIIGHGHCST